MGILCCGVANINYLMTMVKIGKIARMCCVAGNVKYLIHVVKT